MSDNHASRGQFLALAAVAVAAVLILATTPGPLLAPAGDRPADITPRAPTPIVSKEDAERERQDMRRGFWRGMTTEQVRAALGNPADKTISEGSWGRREQWTYNQKPEIGRMSYLYFENGILDSWQILRQEYEP